MQSHNVSLTGGSEGVRYNASLSYYDQDGILLESNYKRIQGRMGTTIQKKKLKIYLTTNYSSTTTTGGSPSQNSYSGMNNLFYSVWGYRPVTEPDRLTLWLCIHALRKISSCQLYCWIFL